MNPAASRSLLHSRSLRSLPPVTAHVEIAHQTTFQLWVRPTHERRQHEFYDEQTATLRNDGTAVLENSNSVRILISVQDMFQHVHIGAGWHGLGQVSGNQLASGESLSSANRGFAASMLASRSTSMPRRWELSSSTASMSDPPPPPRSATTFASEKSHARAMGA